MLETKHIRKGRVITKSLLSEKNDKKRLAVPGGSVNPKDALERYTLGTFDQQIQGYYDTALQIDPEFGELPLEINKMSFIEQQELMVETRIRLKKLLKNANTTAETNTANTEPAAAEGANTEGTAGSTEGATT